MNSTSAVCKRELLIIGAGGFGAVAARVAESMNAAAHHRRGSMGGRRVCRLQPCKTWNAS